MTKILIAEKQTLIRKMLADLLNAEPDFEVVAEASEGGEVIEILQRLQVDFLLMGASWLAKEESNLISRFKVVRPDLTIMIISKNSDTRFISKAITDGVSGYISTMHDTKEFLEALRKVRGGGRYIDANLAESMLLKIISSDAKPEHAGLSRRELEIFRLLVAGKCVNKIADQLNISNKTVSSHKMKLMEKMHFSGMADLMRYAVQRRLFDDEDLISAVPMQPLPHPLAQQMPIAGALQGQTA